jgi:hypothetical protein
MQFVTLENPGSAEQLFNELLRLESKNPALSIFATKLAAAFQRLRDGQKKAHYETLATELSQGAGRGLL